MSLRIRILDHKSIDNDKPYLGIHVMKGGELTVLPAVLEQVHNFDESKVEEIPIVWSTEALNASS